MRCWIEEDNQGIQILGIRWLVKGDRRAGKLAPSLVIYLKDKANINRGVHMGRKIFRTTMYHWGACWAFRVTEIAFESDARFANSGSLPLPLVVFCSFTRLVRCAFGRLGVLCVAASAYVRDGFGGGGLLQSRWWRSGLTGLQRW